MGLWECADVDVLRGKRCFAVESSQAKEVMSSADWPLWPLPSSPPRHHPLCLWFTQHFTQSWYTRCHPSWEVIPNLDENLPPLTPIGSMCNLRGSPLQGMETDHWFWLQRANRCGSVPHKLPLTGPETPRRGLTPHMCTHTSGWLGGPAVFWKNRKHHGCQHISIHWFVSVLWCNVISISFKEPVHHNDIFPSHADRIDPPKSTVKWYFIILKCDVLFQDHCPCTTCISPLKPQRTFKVLAGRYFSISSSSPRLCRRPTQNDHFPVHYKPMT